MTHRHNAITDTWKYRVLPGMVRYTFILFGLFAKPNLPPLTQNSGDATENIPIFPVVIPQDPRDGRGRPPLALTYPRHRGSMHPQDRTQISCSSLQC